MGFLVSLLVLSFLIFFHELGHFLAARWFGVKVEVFSIGFGHKIYKKVYGDTEYALSAIPLGGYVKMKGQDDANPSLLNHDQDSYNAKKPWQRLIILAAGPLANLFLAFLLYVAIALLGSQALAPIINEPDPGLSAAKAGMRSGDEIIRIDGQKVRTWGEMSELISKSQGEIEVEFLRGGQERSLVLLPTLRESKNIFGETILRPMIGVSALGEVRIVSYSLFESLPKALNETIRSSQMIVLGIQKLLSGVVPSSEVGGVISIVQITSKASESGIITLFGLTALISVNLGILNLLPIPALDGGHILFNLYEMVTKKTPSLAVFTNLTIAGWVILAGLMGLGLYNDLSRIAQGVMP
ncbi:RIP metalloprotease RseP [Wolinella succinogenes]|uniref:RIP metalloprotease RseP n=1 Tax=Wolinella succinogenes TaxID=844 RepID=UPI002409C5BE|nr:RIP metalloprotease RseP [Wolinella succinogenes]